MKKLSPATGEHLPPARIYLDDIVEIIDILTAEVADVEIEAGGYRFDDPTELANLPDEVIYEITIRSRDPYVALSVDESRTWLYRGDSEARSRGLFDSVRAVLKRRQRRMPWFGNAAFQGLTGGATLATGVWAIALAAKHAVGASLLLWACFLIALSLFATSIVLYRHPTIIVLRRRADAPGFWKRNADTLLIGLIASVGGAAIGAVLTWLFTR